MKFPCKLNMDENNQNIQSVKDRGGFGWGLLGYIIPIVGLVLYLVWRDERPKTAKAVGVGALVSLIVSILVYVLYFVLVMSFSASFLGMISSVLSSL